MEIRLTRHEPTGIVAVGVAREGDDLPRDVRLVEAADADAVESLVLREDLLGADVVDLDDVLARARRAPRPAAG